MERKSENAFYQIELALICQYVDDQKNHPNRLQKSSFWYLSF
ncbi:MAG: hypothetical protein RL582_1474 [Bacteroidota bacterium]|jgi:hypothetical protein